MKRNIRVEIFSERSCAPDFPEDPVEFIQWWQDKFNMCPLEHKSSLKVEFTTGVYWDSPSISVDIYYYRTESDEEYSSRINATNKRERLMMDKELKELERLTAKYKDKILNDEK